MLEQKLLREKKLVSAGGLSNEKNYTVKMLNNNKNLMPVDATMGMENENGIEELWLNPSSLLMMCQNVRLGLEEYITSKYLKADVDNAYNEIKIELSELDAEYRVAVDSTDDKSIIVADSALMFLEKFGLNVICIDTNPCFTAVC